MSEVIAEAHGPSNHHLINRIDLIHGDLVAQDDVERQRVIDHARDIAYVREVVSYVRLVGDPPPGAALSGRTFNKQRSEPMKAFYADQFVLPLPPGHRFPMAKYRLLRDRLPQTIVVSVSHRSSVDRHHGRALRLSDQGRWQLTQR